MSQSPDHTYDKGDSEGSETGCQIDAWCPDEGVQKHDLLSRDAASNS